MPRCTGHCADFAVLMATTGEDNQDSSDSTDPQHTRVPRSYGSLTTRLAYYWNNVPRDIGGGPAAATRNGHALKASWGGVVHLHERQAGRLNEEEERKVLDVVI